MYISIEMKRFLFIGKRNNEVHKSETVCVCGFSVQRRTLGLGVVDIISPSLGSGHFTVVWIFFCNGRNEILFSVIYCVNFFIVGNFFCCRQDDNAKMLFMCTYTTGDENSSHDDTRNYLHFSIKGLLSAIYKYNICYVRGVTAERLQSPLTELSPVSFYCNNAFWWCLRISMSAM